MHFYMYIYNLFYIYSIYIYIGMHEDVSDFGKMLRKLEMMHFCMKKPPKMDF